MNFPELILVTSMAAGSDNRNINYLSSTQELEEFYDKEIDPVFSSRKQRTEKNCVVFH